MAKALFNTAVSTAASAVTPPGFDSVAGGVSAAIDSLRGFLAAHKDQPKHLQALQACAESTIARLSGFSDWYLEPNLAKPQWDLKCVLLKVHYQLDLWHAKRGTMADRFLRVLTVKAVNEEITALINEVNAAAKEFMDRIGAEQDIGACKALTHPEARGFWRSQFTKEPRVDKDVLIHALASKLEFEAGKAVEKPVIKAAIDAGIADGHIELQQGQIHVTFFNTFVNFLHEKYGPKPVPPVSGLSRLDEKHLHLSKLIVTVHHAQLTCTPPPSGESKMEPKGVLTFPFESPDLFKKEVEESLTKAPYVVKIPKDEGHMLPQWDKKAEFLITFDPHRTSTMRVHLMDRTRKFPIGKVEFDAHEYMRDSLPRMREFTIIADGPAPVPHGQEATPANFADSHPVGTLVMSLQFVPGGGDKYFGFWNPAAESSTKPTLKNTFAAYVASKTAPIAGPPGGALVITSTPSQHDRKISVTAVPQSPLSPQSPPAFQSPTPSPQNGGGVVNPMVAAGLQFVMTPGALLMTPTPNPKPAADPLKLAADEAVVQRLYNLDLDLTDLSTKLRLEVEATRDLRAAEKEFLKTAESKSATAVASSASTARQLQVFTALEVKAQADVKNNAKRVKECQALAADGEEEYVEMLNEKLEEKKQLEAKLVTAIANLKMAKDAAAAAAAPGGGAAVRPRFEDSEIGKPALKRVAERKQSRLEVFNKLFQKYPIELADLHQAMGNSNLREVLIELDATLLKITKRLAILHAERTAARDTHFASAAVPGQSNPQADAATSAEMKAWFEKTLAQMTKMNKNFTSAMSSLQDDIKSCNEVTNSLIQSQTS